MTRQFLLSFCLLYALKPCAAQDAATQCDVGRPELRAYAASHRGDPKRGRELFFGLKPVGCASCHRVRGEGTEMGPDLSDIGGKFGRAHLVEAVLDPSRQIVEGYRATIVTTVDGEVVSGIIRSESADVVTLVDEGTKRHVVRTADIDQRRASDVSLMPERMADGLSKEQFVDLIAYLESLRPTRPLTPGERVEDLLAVPSGFSLRRVTGGLTAATALAVVPDGRVLVCEQTGTLRVVKGDALLAEPFLRVAVDSQWERGLIGVAVDPNFGMNRYVYICYIAREPYPHHRMSRFVAAGNRAQVGSETILFEGDDQRKLGGSVPAGHQGGAIHFGGDGKLYVGIGEQTAGAPAQDLNSLLGKLLRINPDGSIPRDNPFYDRTRGKYRAIWALGLRNAFTFAVQERTGRIFINDVGGAAEEINEGVAGANFGWPTVEHGPTNDRRFRGSIYSYPTASISGGAFCPAHSSWPAKYRGRYFFMDFVKGWINSLDPKRPADVTTFAMGFPRPVDLRFAADGSLYVLTRDAWVIDREFRAGTGMLHKIRWNGEAESSRP